MAENLAFVGFGEAAIAFAEGLPVPAQAYDRKTDIGSARRGKFDDYRRLGVSGTVSNQAAVSGARVVISLVTADQALTAARQTARSIQADALYLDLNSASPGTKRTAAAAIEAAGARYVDVAVTAPVLPLRRAVPILVSGPHAKAATDTLASLGFTGVSIVGRTVGQASVIKMIRSVMIKGIEALTAECLLAAEAAGVRNAVLASLDASWPEADWARRSDYNLDRIIVHGARRADEMDEVVTTLDTFKTGSTMARATAAWQRAIGALGVDAPVGLDAKLAALLAAIHPVAERDSV